MSSMTANDCITRALRRINVIDYDETPDAAQLAQGLDQLNAFLHGLPNVGVEYAHADLSATTTINMPDGLVNALVTAFAGELADEYPFPVAPRFQRRIDEAMNTLRAAFFQPNPAPVDGALRKRGWYNFSTDQSGSP